MMTVVDDVESRAGIDDLTATAGDETSLSRTYKP